MLSLHLQKYEEAVDRLDEILPRNGMTYTEESQSMVFCKPKIMPLKSVTLEKLEKMQREVSLFLQVGALDQKQMGQSYSN